jgi:hypothetical protein
MTAAAPAKAAAASVHTPGSMTNTAPSFSSLTHECPNLVNRTGRVQQPGQHRQLIAAAGETSHLGRELAQGNRGCRRKLEGRLIVVALHNGPEPGQTRWNDQDLAQRLKTMKDLGDTGRSDRTAHLMLTEQSGAKRKVPQPSIGAAMIEAEQAMRRPGCQLRAVKVVRRHRAVARWKVGKQGWHRVA